VHRVQRAAGRSQGPSLGRDHRRHSDNALAESVIGLFKTDLIKPRSPCRAAEDLRGPGDIPSAELEDAYYRHNQPLTEAAL
jgi:putative transposase